MEIEEEHLSQELDTEHHVNANADQNNDQPPLPDDINPALPDDPSADIPHFNEMGDIVIFKTKSIVINESDAYYPRSHADLEKMVLEQLINVELKELFVLKYESYNDPLPINNNAQVPSSENKDTTINPEELMPEITEQNTTEQAVVEIDLDEIRKETTAADSPETPAAPPPAPVPPPTMSRKERKRFERMAEYAEDALDETRGTLSDKEKQAKALERFYNQQLPPPYVMTITVLEADESEHESEIRIHADDNLLTRPRDQSEDVVEYHDYDPNKVQSFDVEAIEGLTDDEQQQVQQDFESLSDDENNEVEVLVALGKEIKGGRKVKKKEGQEDNDALNYIITLVDKPTAIVRSVVVMLGMDLLDILEKARLDKLWVNETSARAVIQAIQLAPESITKEMIRSLLKTSFFSFDWFVDRFEARLAWELLITLPHEEQIKYLTSKGIPEDKAEEELRKRIQGRVEKNLSSEYKESSRFDTYDGNATEEMYEQQEIHAYEDEETQKDKQKANADAQAQTDIYNDVVGSENIVDKDTNLESLLASTLEDELWTNAGRLEGVLRLVIQADQAAFVQEKVKEHWASHTEIFQSLGFMEDGRWSENIEDNTFTTFFSRFFAGASVVLDVAWGLITDKDVIDLDFETLNKTWLANGYGMRLEEVDEPLDVLALIFGGAEMAATVLSALGIGPVELLETLASGLSAKSKIEQYLKDKQTLQDAEGRSLDPESNKNELIVTMNDDTGQKTVSIPNLSVLGQAATFGENTIKSDNSTLTNATIAIKEATANSGKEFVSVEISSIKINNLLIVTPQNMTTVGYIEITNLKLKADGNGAKPADMASKILSNAQSVVIKVLQNLPTVGVATKLTVGIPETLNLYFNSESMYDFVSEGDLKQISFGFDKLDVKNIVDSGGNAVDSIEVGATEFFATPELSAVYDWKEEAELEAEIADIEKDLSDEGLRDDQRLWLEETLDSLKKQIANYGALEEKHNLLLPLTLEKDALDKKAADEGAELTDAEQYRLDELNEEINLLTIEMTAIMGATASGTIGATQIDGVDWEGTSVKQITTSAIELDYQGSAEDVQTGNEHTLDATVSNLETGGGERRDIVIPRELLKVNERIVIIGSIKKEIDLANTASPDDTASTESAASITYDADSIERLEALDEELEKIQEVKEALEQELLDLQPLLKEYDLLRARMTDTENPLIATEKDRLATIKEQLEQPPTLTIDSIVVKGAVFDTSVSNVHDAENSTSTEFGAESVRLEGVSMQSAGYTLEGDKTIDSVEMTGVSGTVNLNETGTLDFEADSTTIEGIHQGGKSEDYEAQHEDIEAEIDQLNKEIAALEGQNTDTAKDRLVQLKARLEALQRRKSDLESEGDEKSLLQTFIDNNKNKAILDHNGFDRYEAYSYHAAEDGIHLLERYIYELNNGKKENDPLEVCMKNATSYIEQYTAAKASLKAAIDGSSQSATGKNLEARSEQAHIDRNLEDLQEDYDAVSAQLDIWTKHQQLMQPQLDKYQAEIRSVESILHAYDKFIKDAEAHKVEVKEKDYGSIKDLSAASIVKIAEAERNEWENVDIAKVSVTEANVQIQGLQHVLDADEESGAFAGTVVLQSGDEGPMASSVSIEGYTQGYEKDEDGNLVPGENASVIANSIDIKNIDGRVSIEQPREGHMNVKIEDFSMGDLTLSALNWTSPSMSMATSGSVHLKNIKTSLDIQSIDGAMLGTISSFQIQELTASDMTLGYGDYEFVFGPTTGGGTLAAVSVSDYNLTNGSFAGLTLNEMETEKMRADLGGGMKVGAESMTIGKLEVGAIVTEGAQQRAKEDSAQNEEEGASDYPSDGTDADANQYSIDLSGVDADQMRVQLEESGVDVTINKINDAKLTGFTIDLMTGNFKLDQVYLKGINLGPVRYNSEGIYLEMSSAKLGSVYASAEGQFNFDERQIDEAREDGVGLDTIQSLIFSKIIAKRASLSNLHMTSKDPTGAEMQVSLPSAKMEEMTIDDYNVKTNSMGLSLKGAKMDELGLILSDGLSTNTFLGDVQLKSLNYKGLFDEDGALISAGVSFAGANVSGGELGVDSTSVGEDGDSSSAKGTTMLDVTNASGTVDVEKDGMTTTTNFSDIDVGNISVPSLDWTLTGSSFQYIKGDGISLKSMSASGIVTTEMQNTTVETGEEVLLPQSRIEITSLKIVSMNAKSLTYRDVNSAQEDQEQVDVSIENAKATDIRLNNLLYDDKEFQQGRLDIGRVDASVAGSQGVIGPRVNSLIGGGSKLTAKGLYLNFLDGEDHIQMGASETIIRNAYFDYLDESSEFRIDIPEAYVEGFDMDIIDQSDVEINETVKAHVDKIVLKKDAPFIYTDKSASVDREKSSEELQEEAEAAQQSDADLHRRWSNANWYYLLNSLNGAIKLEVNTNAYENVNIVLPVKNGAIDTQEARRLSDAELSILLHMVFGVGKYFLPDIQLDWGTSKVRNLFEPAEEEAPGRVDFYVDNFDIDIKGGPLSSISFFSDEAGDGSKELLKVNQFDLDFVDQGNGKYNAALNLDDFVITKATTNERGDKETMSVSVGDIDLKSKIDQLLPQGRYYIAGGDGSITTNPIKGTMLTDSSFENIDIVTQKIYRE